MTVTTETVSLPQEWLNVPLLHPPVGMNAKKEADALKEKYPVFKEGKSIRVPDELITTFCMLLAAARHFDSQDGQGALAKNMMRRAMKDRQFAVDGEGREVASRRMTPKEGYNVPSRVDDSIIKARGR